jgi:hypothetical protein
MTTTENTGSLSCQLHLIHALTGVPRHNTDDHDDHHNNETIFEKTATKRQHKQSNHKTAKWKTNQPHIASANVPVEESFAAEHGGEVLGHALKHLLMQKRKQIEYHQ